MRPMMPGKEVSRRLPPCSEFICGPFNDGSNAIEAAGCVALCNADIVVLDNLSAHKDKEALALIAAVGAEV